LPRPERPSAPTDGTTAIPPPSAIAAFHQVESFLLSLTDANDDGRILLHAAPSASGEPVKVTLKYILLNPAEHFKTLVDEARCVVLAGGTMEPVRRHFPARIWEQTH
jgi:Rad3-related DNA helicase